MEIRAIEWQRMSFGDCKMSEEEQNSDKIQSTLLLLGNRGIQLDSGLSDGEVERTENYFGFRFPFDLRGLLQTALPVGGKPGMQSGAFPNWRSGDLNELEGRLNWPFEGMAFDIENNVFWLDEWGTKPDNTSEALKIAQEKVSEAPRLIPVYSHRYIPSEPSVSGNPVFSVHQTDIIYYGQNLWDYFEQEFGEHDEGWYGGERYSNFTREQYLAAHRHISFWSDLVS